MEVDLKQVYLHCCQQVYLLADLSAGTSGGPSPDVKGDPDHLNTFRLDITYKIRSEMQTRRGRCYCSGICCETSLIAVVVPI